MAERGITEAHIESALGHAHTVISQSGSVTYVGPGVNGADLKVWAVPPGYVDDATMIKSVVWRGTA